MSTFESSQMVTAAPYACPMRQEVEVARNGANVFQCVLADQPHYLVPRRLLPEDIDHCADSDLQVNPHCWFSWQGDAPRPIARCLPLPSKFRRDFDTVWIYDPRRRLATPFWVGPRARDSIAHLRPGAHGHGLTSKTRSRLAIARVLVDPADEPALDGAWNAERSRAAREFHERGYTSMQALLHPFHLGNYVAITVACCAPGTWFSAIPAVRFAMWRTTRR